MEHILFTGIDTQNGKSMYKYKKAKISVCTALALTSHEQISSARGSTFMP